MPRHAPGRLLALGFAVLWLTAAPGVRAAPGQAARTVHWLGWFPDGERFAYLEARRSEAGPAGFAAIYSASLRRILERRELTGALAQFLLEGETAPAEANPALELAWLVTEGLVRETLPLAQGDPECGPEDGGGCWELPGGEGWLRAVSVGSRSEPAWRLELVPSGSTAPYPVRRLEVGPGAIVPKVHPSPDGRTLALEVAWDGAASLELIDLRSAWADAYQAEGLRAYQAGELAEAERWLLRAWLRDPVRPETLYNRACVAARRGERAEAVRLLGEAIERGGRRFAFLALRDPDFSVLREWADFQELVRDTERGGDGRE